MKFNPNDKKYIEKIKNNYVLGKKERVIDVIHKHPANLIITYVYAIAGYLFVLVATYLLVPYLFNSADETGYTVITFVAMFMAVLIGLILVIATFLYSQTKLIISNENLIQVLQKDLLHNKTSRLALTDIEDVTSEQKGFLATMLGYGNLCIETAGEQVNFLFTFCPNPNLIAKELIDAKEDLISGITVYE